VIFPVEYGEGIAVLSPFYKCNQMLRVLCILLAIVYCSACRYKKPEPAYNYEKEKLVLLDADRAFSKMSEEKGMKTAFMDYIDSNGVLLRPGYLPIVGADAVDFLSQLPENEYTMKWEPAGGDIAKSGEMGYTYGTFKITPNTKDTVVYGTYVSVWKKQADGSWKLVLDSGNEGVGQEEPVQEDTL
jgi:ketosteroid isomerase-like protein